MGTLVAGPGLSELKKPPMEVVTLSVLYSDTSYFSSLYGNTITLDNVTQYMYSGLVIPPGNSTIVIRGRYNIPGDYSWKITIASGSSYYRPIPVI
jgi:hypothetical protein